MSKRWSYQVIEIKPNIWSWGSSGLKREAVQSELTRQGVQGWELVSIVQASALSTATLIFKKEQ